jgi:hypothetical protein
MFVVGEFADELEDDVDICVQVNLGPCGAGRRINEGEEKELALLCGQCDGGLVRHCVFQ